jgi:hypothetical protein
MGNKFTVAVDAKKQHVCPECKGKTRQFRPDEGNVGRPSSAMNTVRVDHHLDCARWNFIMRTWPKLVGMRKIATPVI